MKICCKINIEGEIAMKTAEISTITILHTISKLNKRQLAQLSRIASGKAFNDTTLPGNTGFCEKETLLKSLLESFNVDSEKELYYILKEICFDKMLNMK